MSIKEKVMVVSLSISQWTARRYDAKASKEVESSHGATDAGRFNKLLISRDSVLKEIGKVVNSARTYHYDNTLPWAKAQDILPVANLFNYTNQMGIYQSQFDSLVDKLVTVYPTLIDEAKARLNTLFKEEDYPPVALLRKKFGMNFQFMPVADEQDLRVSISEDEAAKIRDSIRATITDRVENAVSTMLDRMRTAVGHMAETLAEPDKIFRDSLVTNICDLIDVIPLLNFNDDKHVNDVVEYLRPLCIKDIDALRTNKLMRKDIAERAQKIVGLI